MSELNLQIPTVRVRRYQHRKHEIGGVSRGPGPLSRCSSWPKLVFTIFMLAAEKHRGMFIAPVGGWDRVVAVHCRAYVSPTLGSLLASGFYIFIKPLECETVDPQQDQPTDGSAEPKPALQHYENHVRSWDDGSAGSARVRTSYRSGSGIEAEHSQECA
ncbi:uncharacterized protein F4812DRAFT_455298 [Daldinia caldariorum]|uniref:uncharacterized protein n=1 Tax=Daldinia caldariorum TaxID=326644 RepID=UPI00200888C2|nr:uncharacterized protein F4812DRAFT_455298 [Daldinia caldariorum]KAI1471187.1 hypothetical protein F4812DRAFT_455298 [Daldinia caldariorum]